MLSSHGCQLSVRFVAMGGEGDRKLFKWGSSKVFSAVRSVLALYLNKSVHHNLLILSRLENLSTRYSQIVLHQLLIKIFRLTDFGSHAFLVPFRKGHDL